MKIKFLIAFLAALLLPAGISHAAIVDKIIAIVNDQVITQAEMDRVLYPIYLQYKGIYKSEEELYKELDKTRAKILAQLIDDNLILCEARKLGITADEKEIDAALENTRNDIAKRGMDLNTMLKEQNITLGDLRVKYKDQIMVQKAVDRMVRGKISIQPSEVSAYYHTHIDDYTQPEQVAAYAILIRLQGVRTPLESRKLADDVYKMLLDGGDFKRLAKNYSEDAHREEGGDFGYVSRGQLLKEIDDVIFSLNVDEVSGIIESPIGYHIFKVYDKKDKKTLPFQEVNSKVTDTLYRAKAQVKFEEWLEKLRANAYISIK